MNQSSYLLFCGGTINFRPAIKTFIIHSGVIEVIMSLSLLYMFSHGLYKLYMTLLQQHVKEYLVNYDGDTIEEEHDEDDSEENIRMQTMESCKVGTNKGRLSSGDSLSGNGFSAQKAIYKSRKSTSICERQSIERVIGLRNIIKKQTILVFIALGSSIIYWILSMVYPSMSIQSGWDIMINVTCIWLMFGTAKPVWECLVRYCLCRVCY